MNGGEAPGRLCRLDELDDPGSAGFTVETASGPRAIMVVRRDGEVFGYLNNCPHIGAPLDWQEGQFLDLDRQFILCASHGALFRMEDGYCIGGPCAGKSLEKVDLRLEDGVVWWKP